MLFHPTLAITPERLCLGVIDNDYWAREKLQRRTAKEKKRVNHTTPIKAKESYCWIKGYQKANAIAAQLPETMVVSVADREADIYDLYHQAEQQQDAAAYWLVRASGHRRLLDTTGRPDSIKLVEKAKQTAPLCTITCDYAGNHGEPKRNATQTLYATELTLCPPDRKFGRKPTRATVVVATEINPPTGQTPIE